MASTLIYILYYLIGFFIFAIIASAILSWLVVFNVINIRHPVARQIVDFLEAVTRPILAPFRRFIPPLGGVDITPIIAIIVLGALQGPFLNFLARILTPVLG